MPSLSKSSLALPWRRRVGLCEAEAEKDKVHIGSKSVREGVGTLGGRSSFLEGRKEERKKGRKEGDRVCKDSNKTGEIGRVVQSTCLSNHS